MVKGFVAQIASPSIFNGGIKLKTVHPNYQIIEKKFETWSD